MCQMVFYNGESGDEAKKLLSKHYREMLSVLETDHANFIEYFSEKHYQFFRKYSRRGYDFHCHGCNQVNCLEF